MSLERRRNLPLRRGLLRSARKLGGLLAALVRLLGLPGLDLCRIALFVRAAVRLELRGVLRPVFLLRMLRDLLRSRLAGCRPAPRRLPRARARGGASRL